MPLIEMLYRLPKDYKKSNKFQLIYQTDVYENLLLIQIKNIQSSNPSNHPSEYQKTCRSKKIVHLRI